MKTITFDETKWKLVPVEPTKEMTQAMADRIVATSCGGIVGTVAAYRAMLAATPAVPSQPVTLTDSTIDAAAKVLAERFGYSWEHMPEQGRENMRKNVRNVVAALREKEQAT